MTRKINVGGVSIGGGAAVTVQSMCTARTGDVDAVCAQIDALAAAGCQIVRVAVPDMDAARAIKDIKKRITLPLVADIHFDYKLALASVDAGADKIRINPGNIGSAERVKAVADACRERGIPIRIGVNGGSLEKGLLAKYGGPTANALCESAVTQAAMLEEFGFSDICVSVKSSSVAETVKAYRLMAEKTDYPLHLGVTEAGTEFFGTVNSAVAMGALLLDGIGDTIRVSLTADPVREVHAGIAILKAAGARQGGVRIVSCPTCGRCKIDLISLAHDVEKRVTGLDRDITVAVMGCAVNGPGEARDADFGVAGGDGEGLLFMKGEIVGKVPYTGIADQLMKLIEENER